MFWHLMEFCIGKSFFWGRRSESNTTKEREIRYSILFFSNTILFTISCCISTFKHGWSFSKWMHERNWIREQKRRKTPKRNSSRYLPLLYYGISTGLNYLRNCFVYRHRHVRSRFLTTNFLLLTNNLIFSITKIFSDSQRFSTMAINNTSLSWKITTSTTATTVTTETTSTTATTVTTETTTTTSSK